MKVQTEIYRSVISGKYSKYTPLKVSNFINSVFSDNRWTEHKSFS